MLDVSAAYTAAIKDKNRTDRITGAIKLCDGETINITDDIIVNNSVTLKEQLVSGDTFEIGTFYTNQLDITVYDENFLTRTYANARITPKYEIQLTGGTWESVPLGIFTVDNSLTKRKGSIHKLTAFDDSTKFDVDISAYSGGKKTVQQHIKELAADVGITLATTDFSSYPNYDLTVDSGTSTAVQTYRDLIEWCCALMSASARINRYGKLEIVKLKEKTKTVDGTLVYDADYTVEGYERTGTEFFDLRALTKYFSTTFDGEQYVYKNSAMITTSDSAARNATMFLPENPLLQSVSDRKAAFEACADAINIALRRVEFSFNGNPAIECFDTLCGNGGKIDVNRTIAFFPTSLVWKYRGAHKVSCAFAELTDEATASVSEVTTFTAAVANKSPLSTKNKTDKRIDDVAKRANGVGKFTNADKNCEIFNDYENNVASSYYAHAEGKETTASAPYSHAEGRETVAYELHSHAEGYKTVAGGQSSHAEGENCRAIGSYSHAEGYKTVANGVGSHASGLGTVAEDDVTFAIGRWNKTSGGLFVVGNGWNSSSDESDARRSDALVLDTMGNLHIAGKLTADGGVDSGSSDGGGSSGYTLPVATADTLGGIKIGNNLSIAADGTLSAEAQPDIASASKAGIVKVGENIDVTADGTISIPAPCTLRIDNKASANLVHKYVPVTTSEEKIYYGDISNSIVCNGYTFWGSGMTIATPGVFLDFSPTLMVEKFAKTASGEIIEDCDFQVALVNVDSKAFKSYRLESKKAVLTTTSVYKNYSVQFDPIIFPKWKSIIAPTNNHPYGRIQVTLSLMYVNSSNEVATGNSISGYIDFATEAEYNAAVCLTHSSVRTTRMEERTNAFIIPSSISLVTDKRPETGEEDVLYLIYDKDTAPAMKEYLWHNGAWRYLGTTSVDLSEYLKSTDISAWAKAATKPTYTAKEVGAATAADITAAVNAVSIGGRNIITGTAEAVIGYGGHSKGHWRKYGTAGTIQTVDITDAPISCVSKGIRLTSTDENSQIICGQDDISLNSGVIYTFSCRIRSNSAEGVPCRLQPFYKSTTDHSGNTQDIIISDEWQYISFTAKFSPQSTGTYSGARIYLQPTAAGNYIEVCAMKLEAGNKPTDWSPAPEDAERRITSLEARVAALEAAAVSGGEV